MKNKMLALLGAVLISAGTIGGVAFASNINGGSFKGNQQVSVKESSIGTNQITVEKGNAEGISANANSLKENQQVTVKEESINTNQKAEVNNDVEVKDITKKISNSGRNNNPSKDIYEDMSQIMIDNGFKDAARYMQTGDYDAMTNYMNTLSEEDYDKMIEIMNNNGYSYMGQMMESIGRENMIDMHNSMMPIRGREGNGRSYKNMMSGF